jgi:hypothetical protein
LQITAVGLKFCASTEKEIQLLSNKSLSVLFGRLKKKQKQKKRKTN